MAIEGDSATVPLSPAERMAGLNHVARLRAEVFGQNVDAELARFLNDMRDPRGENASVNGRALSAIFFTAQIPAARHGVEVNELTTDEKRRLIAAMNQLRAVVSLFPKRLSMPN